MSQKKWKKTSLGEDIKEKKKRENGKNEEKMKKGWTEKTERDYTEKTERGYTEKTEKTEKGWTDKAKDGECYVPPSA